MKSKLIIASAVAGFLCLGAQAGVVQFNTTDISLGYMNVSDLGGGFQFGSSWGVADLVVTVNGAADATLSPNTIGDPDPYWYIGGGGPGAQGNKIMEANWYAQDDIGTHAGDTLTFEGFITSDTLSLANNPGNVDAGGNGWEAYIYIRDGVGGCVQHRPGHHQ